MGNETYQPSAPPAEPPVDSAAARRRRTTKWAAIIAAAVAVTIVAGIIIATVIGRALAPATPDHASRPVTDHVVVYQADGGGARGIRSASFTIRSDNGGTVQGSSNLPLKNKLGDLGLKYAGFGSGDFVYLSVQNEDAAGSVTCRIVVDGVTISENTSTGGYVIATCQGQVP